MPTYVQLNTEAAWRDEFDPPALASLKRRLQARYGEVVWTKGDNRHVRGRHRSRRWCLTSAFSKSRTYGTRDARDLRGDENWLRALDLGTSGPPLWAACRRVDAAVRAGQLPGLAEWFGTFDGRTVVGWFEGRPGSSDDSHLTHGHFGFWTEAANDQSTMDRLYDLIIGEDDDMTPDERREHWFSIWRQRGMQLMQDPIVIPANLERGVPTKVEEPNLLAQAIKALGAGGTGQTLTITGGAITFGGDAGK